MKAIANSTTGILMSGTSEATTSAAVTETQSFGNGTCGFDTLGQYTYTGGGFGYCTSCTRIMTVNHSTASNNSSGICEGGVGATVTVANTVASHNSIFGFEQAFGGTFRSAQNNVVTDNGSGPTYGTITTGGVLY